MPGPGKNSYMVTTGPGRISTTSPTMPKSASLARSFSAVARNASLSSAVRSFLSHSSTSSGGSVKLLRSPTNSNWSWSFRRVGFGGALGSTMSGMRASAAAVAVVGRGRLRGRQRQGRGRGRQRQSGAGDEHRRPAADAGVAGGG